MARVGEARARRDEAKKTLANLTNNVVSEVRTAVTQVEAAQQELLLQRSNAALVQQNRDLVEKEYAAGQGSLVRLNEAQRDLVTAQSRLALALVSLRLAWQNLLATTGEILVSHAHEPPSPAWPRPSPTQSITVERTFDTKPCSGTHSG